MPELVEINDERSPEYYETSLNELLNWSVTSGGFSAAVVTTMDGLPLASVKSNIEPETLAALSSLFDNTASRAESFLGWTKVEEMSLVSSDGVRLVIRPFAAEVDHYMLVVVVPAGKSYRRVTNRVLRGLAPLMKRWSEADG